MTAGAGANSLAPLWFTSNRYGLGSQQVNSALFRASLLRRTDVDSLRSWRFGYGADVAGAANHDSKLYLQQLFADVRWRMVQLSVGQKERPMELKDQALSSGGMSEGINARPVPQVRVELPDFWAIPRTRDWLWLKAHVAYGAFTDNQWQQHSQGTTQRWAKNVLYHSKAIFVRLGNERQFPLRFTAGVESKAQFGGTAYNVMRREDDDTAWDQTEVRMPTGLSAYWDALTFGGSDQNDGAYANVAGNQLGSWHMRLDFDLRGWGLSGYAEHFFEDTSGLFLMERYVDEGQTEAQLFRQYTLRDMLYGAELRLPYRWLSKVVYEHLRTTDQCGSIYHNYTSTIADQITGVDNYYNHGTYTGWHHAGYSMGTPLLISPIYNSSSEGIRFMHNRVVAHHVGIGGEPHEQVSYRVLYTYERSLGSYEKPLTDPQTGRFLLVEATYRPVKSVALTLAYGQNKGDLLGTSHAARLSVTYKIK